MALEHGPHGPVQNGDPLGEKLSEGMSKESHPSTLGNPEGRINDKWTHHDAKMD